MFLDQQQQTQILSRELQLDPQPTRNELIPNDVYVGEIERFKIYLKYDWNCNWGTNNGTK